MRKLAKFGKIKTKVTALALALVMCVPTTAWADDWDYYYSEDEDYYEGPSHEELLQNIIDEAKELGVTDAYIRRNFAEEYAAEKMGSYVTELVEGETKQPKIKIENVTSSSGKSGIVINKVDTGILARTKFDLGSFDFGELKAGRAIYNMLAKKNLKGTAYFYVDDVDDPIAEFKIKRTADEEWGETKNLAVDVSDANLTDEQHIYFNFVAESALDDEGNIIPESGTKGNIYLESMFFTEGSTPVIDFDLDKEVTTIEEINGSENHSIMGYGNMNIDVPEGYVSEFNNKEIEDGSYELDYIRGRGNSTWLVDKKPYKVKLDKAADLFGMGKNKHWVLLANYYDYSLIRNQYTFYLAEKLGLEFTPKSVCVDVVISGEYCGSYQFSQQVRVGETRVEIDDLEEDYQVEEPGVTGGYLLSMGESWLTESEEDLELIKTTPYTFAIESPEYADDYPVAAKEAQLKYINTYMGELDLLVNSLDPEYDPDAVDEGDLGFEPNYDSEEEPQYDITLPEGKTWRDYMDEKSFIDYYLLQEFSSNGDSYLSSSTYLYKKRDGKLYWGPVWDFDFVAWAAYDTGYLRSEGKGFEMASRTPWLGTLLKYDEDFKENLISRWEELSQILKESAEEGGYLDQLKEKTYYSALANYQVRSSYLMDGAGYWGDDIRIEDAEGNPYTLNYYNEIDRLKEYVKVRAAWVDENIETIDEYLEFLDSIEPIVFYVDDEVYAVVDVDPDDGKFEMPENPSKDGLIFKGWYYTDEEGEEYKLRPNNPPIYIDFSTWTIKTYPVHAVFVTEDNSVRVESMSFAQDTIYVPMYEYVDEEYGFSYYDEAYINLENFLNVLPFDADMEDLYFEVEDEANLPIYVYNDGSIEIYNPCEFDAVAYCNDASATIHVVATSINDVTWDSDFTVDESLELAVGEYGNVNLKYDADNVPYYEYENIVYSVLDGSIAEVNGNGVVYGKASGETYIFTIKLGEDGNKVKITKVIVTDGSEVKPDEIVADGPEAGTKVNDKKYTYKVTKAGSTDGQIVGELAVTGLKKKSIKTVKIASKVTIDGVTYKVTSVAKNAFKGNKKITKAIIGKSVKTIGTSAFANAKKLKSVTINSTVLKSIGKYAFKGDKKLSKIIIKSKKLKKIGKKAFYKTSKKLVVKVPKAKKKAYKKLVKKAGNKKAKVK